MKNRLAIIGASLLGFLLLFSFVGGIFYPYSKNEVF